MAPSSGQADACRALNWAAAAGNLLGFCAVSSFVTGGATSHQLATYMSGVQAGAQVVGAASAAETLALLNATVDITFHISHTHKSTAMCRIQCQAVMPCSAELYSTQLLAASDFTTLTCTVPVGMFKSLTHPQQSHLRRMASTPSGPTNQRTSAGNLHHQLRRILNVLQM
jgi:hypothetical protein